MDQNREIMFRIGKPRQFGLLKNYKENVSYIMDGTFIWSEKHDNVYDELNFQIDPETSIYNYPMKVLTKNRTLAKYSRFLNREKKEYLAKNGFIASKMLEEFLKASLAKTVFNLQNGRILKKAPVKYSAYKYQYNLSNGFVAPYFRLENPYDFENIVELNNLGYNIMTELVKEHIKTQNSPHLILEITDRNLTSSAVSMEFVTNVLRKKKPEKIFLKLIKSESSSLLSENQFKNLHDILLKIKDKSTILISQNLGLEGVVLSWLIDSFQIVRGIFSENPYIRQQPTRSSSGFSKPKPSGYIWRTYNQKTMEFIPHTDLNCNCHICKEKENMKINHFVATHTIQSLQVERSEMINTSLKNRKELVINKIDNILNENKTHEYISRKQIDRLSQIYNNLTGEKIGK